MGRSVAGRWVGTCVMGAVMGGSLEAQVPAGPSPEPVRAKHAMVVTIQHDATDVGVAILKEGGNAVDAAVAVGFALAVVFPQAGNIGGGGFMLVREKGGAAHFLDYREEAPGAATADMYLDAAKNVVPGMSTKGYKAIGVPGTVAGLVYAEKTYGKLGLAKVMAPAIRLAANGYVLSDVEAKALGNAHLADFPESKRVFQRAGEPGAKPYAGGEVFAQPDLAKTLTRIALNEGDFYHGEIARRLVADMQAHGGLITMEDLAAYQVKDRAPVVGHYKGYEIVTAPPPSSGGIVMLETLNILSGFDLTKAGGDRSPGQIHLITESFRRAYKDRAEYLGDPDFAPMPVKEMGSMEYAAAWRKGIDPVRPTPSKDLVRPEGFLPPPPTGVTVHKESTETTHYSIVDAQGNAVSCTYTLNGLFGSGVTAEGLGFVLNNEMDDFSSKPGTANMYGLIQGPANAIGPRHRPLSAMTPTIVTRNGRVAMVLGSPGGSTIITTVTNDFLSVVENGLTIQQAADAPRFHHQYLPDVLEFEKAFPRETVAAMAATGYKVSQVNAADEKIPGLWGDSELIMVDPKTGELLGGHDRRRSFGKAAGY